MEMREGKTGHYKLRDHVQEKNKHMWPTPAAQEPGWKHIEVVDKDGNTPEHPAQRFFHKETGRLVQKGLEQVAAMWPTPTALTGHNSGRMDEWGGSGNPFRRGQTQDAKNSPSQHNGFWPTPHAGTREGQTAGGHAGLASSAHMRKKLKEMAGEEGKKMATQALNPDWVEWLMNWPIGWSDLAPLGDISAWEENIQEWWDYDPADYGVIPRITTKKKDRVNRLKAIGNGQVPLCAAVAFLLLQGDLL